jgi:hypothetical protein
MTTIVKFPESRIVREVQPNLEEIEKAKEKGKQNYADGIVSEVAAGLYAELENYGIDVDDEKQALSKDFIFLTDVLKAVVYRNMGLEHPLHSFVEDNVAIFTDETEYKNYLEKMDKEDESETTEV